MSSTLSPGPAHSPTVTAVMMGDTKRERRTLLVTEKHCWHPDRLLLRLWPSTSRTNKTGEGLCRDLHAHSPALGSLPSPGRAVAAATAAWTPPPSPQGQAAMTVPPPQLRCPWTRRPLPPFAHPNPRLSGLGGPSLEGAGVGSREGPRKEGPWGVRVAEGHAGESGEPRASARLSGERDHGGLQYLPTHVDGDPNGNDRDSDARDEGDHHGRPQHHAQLPQDLPCP